MLADKALLCKALFDPTSPIASVSLPGELCLRACLDVLEKFFGVLALHDLHKPGHFGRPHDSSVLLDLEAARTHRAILFESTLLSELQPLVFDAHFCKHPVIRISLALSSADCTQPERAYRRLVGNAVPLIYKLISSFNRQQLNHKQKKCHDALAQTHTQCNALLGSVSVFQEDARYMLSMAFSCLADFAASISPERHVVIVEDCNMPFVELQGKPAEQELRPVLPDLFSQTLNSNGRLLKLLLVGIYAAPLDELSLDSSTASIIPAFNNYFQHHIRYPLTSEQVIASMFGFSSSEVSQMAEKTGIDSQDALLLDYFGGFDFGYSEARTSSTQIVACLAEIKTKDQKYMACSSTFHSSQNRRLRLLKLFVSKPHSAVKATKANHCKNADDLLSNFATDASANPGNANSSLDQTVPLLVLLGYVTIGNSNALRIPNNAMHDLWEPLHLLATFKMPVSVQQDIKQHQLIGSLYSGETELPAAEFTSALQQTSAANVSHQVQIEFMCRVLLSKLAAPKYTYDYRRANLEYCHELLADPQYGKPWPITLLQFGRYIQALTLALCFQQISLAGPEETGTNPGYPAANAQHHLQLNLAVLIGNTAATVVKPS
ncbi:hypothetical protein IWW42_005876, partial [Coemansia sp. RSA 1085]